MKLHKSGKRKHLRKSTLLRPWNYLKPFVVLVIILMLSIFYFIEVLVLSTRIIDSLWVLLQVEYYFSDENLPTDKHMLGLIKKNKEGFGKSF